MSKQRRRIQSAAQLSEHATIFRCPLCSASMSVIEARSFVCENRHSFDLAKEGYINVLTRPHQTQYNKSLFSARQAISQAGFFTPLVRRLFEIMIKELTVDGEPLKILDAGCGEGSHLITLLRMIQNQTKLIPIGVGMDIAKEGIKLAAKAHEKAMWCVADLASSPFADQQFDVILNILSPSNYAEFKRILKYNGLVIKVVPEHHHLQELREHFYKNTEKDHYSNEQTLQRFEQQFKLIHTDQIEYKANLNSAELEKLIDMTPLSWGVSPEQIEEFKSQPQAEITAAFTILLGTAT